MKYLNLRNQKIDLLRGIAILLVLLLHFHLTYHLDQSILNHIFSSNFISTFASNGNYGVTIFFVISGFLITSMSIQRYNELRKINITQFYIYRFARIMPCLALALFLIVLFSFTSLSIFKNDPNTTSLSLAIFSVLTFWHNLLMEKLGYFNYCLNIYWSLSIEEVFYVAFPLLCVFFRRLWFIVLLLSALIIIGPITRSLHSNNEIVALYGYFSCFDAIAVGCIAAIFANKIKLKNQVFINTTKYLATTLAIIIYCHSNIMNNVVIGVSLMELCTAALLIIAVQQNGSIKSFAAKIVCWFGKNSYELYLFHIIVLAVMKSVAPPEKLGNTSKIIWLSLFLLLSVCLSEIIAKYYSQTLNTKLRKLLLSNKKVVSTELTT